MVSSKKTKRGECSATSYVLVLLVQLAKNVLVDYESLTSFDDLAKLEGLLTSATLNHQRVTGSFIQSFALRQCVLNESAHSLLARHPTYLYYEYLPITIYLYNKLITINQAFYLLSLCTSQGRLQIHNTQLMIRFFRTIR